MNEKDLQILGNVVSRTWEDANYKAALLANPKDVLLLMGMGCEPMAKELLANRKALEQIAFQGSDVLSLGSLGERLSGNGGTE